MKPFSEREMIFARSKGWQVKSGSHEAFLGGRSDGHLIEMFKEGAEENPWLVHWFNSQAVRYRVERFKTLKEADIGAKERVGHLQNMMSITPLTPCVNSDMLW